jgi:hypothetical protein
MSFLNGPAPDFGPNFVNRLKKRCPFVFLVFMRSKNQNVVVYEANVKNGKFDRKNPVSVYWLDVDPKYRSKNRVKGIAHDREELNLFEKKFVWGCSTKMINDMELNLHLKLDKQQPLLVKLGKKGANLFVVWQKEPYYVRSAFVAATENVKLSLRSNISKLTFQAIHVKTKKAQVLNII